MDAMSFFKNLFGQKQAPIPKSDGMDLHLVRLHIPVRGEMGDDDEFDRWVALEDALGEAAEAAGLGELDGNEIGDGEFTIWLYGPDAARLAQLVKEKALDHNLPPGCRLSLRHGGVEDLGAKEESYGIT